MELRYNRKAVKKGKKSTLSSVNNAGTKIAWTCLWSEGNNLTRCKLCGAFSRGSLTSSSLFYLCLTDQAIQYLLAPAVQRFICLFVAFFFVVAWRQPPCQKHAFLLALSLSLSLSFKFLFYHSWSATWNHRATEITHIYARSFLKAMSSSVSPEPLFAGLWRCLVDLGISTKKPTRRGCRAGQRKLKPDGGNILR